MESHRHVRRRSPSFVRDWTSEDLHAVAIRFNHERASGDLSAQQEWLWDGIISELEYRRRRAIVTNEGRPCSCELCVTPFGLYVAPFMTRPPGTPISPRSDRLSPPPAS